VHPAASAGAHLAFLRPRTLSPLMGRITRSDAPVLQLWHAITPTLRSVMVTSVMPSPRRDQAERAVASPVATPSQKS
jgi:hypothetical protein